MAKLYFRHGVVGSAKTLNLLAVAHSYRQQNKEVLLLKPKLDDRFGVKSIASRAGLKMEADFLLEDSTLFSFKGRVFGGSSDLESQQQVIVLDRKKPVSCLILDEVQFLSERICDVLAEITILFDIPVICYGLKTDFRGKMFVGSKRLIELADRIEEIKTTCFNCNKKATYNLKLQGQTPVFSGRTIELGVEDKYLPSCKYCYYNARKEKKLPPDFKRYH